MLGTWALRTPQFRRIQTANRRHRRWPAYRGAARGDGGRRSDAGFTRGVDLPEHDIDRVKSHLAKYYAKLDETAPWERN